MEMAFILNKAWVIFIALFLLSSKVIAQESSNIEYVFPLQVSYIDGDNNALCFNVDFGNKSSGAFKMPVFDETTGETLFLHNYSACDFEKKFKIPRLTDSNCITSLVRSAKENTQLSHKVKVTTRVVDETVS